MLAAVYPFIAMGYPIPGPHQMDFCYLGGDMERHYLSDFNGHAEICKERCPAFIRHCPMYFAGKINRIRMDLDSQFDVQSLDPLGTLLSPVLWDEF